MTTPCTMARLSHDSTGASLIGIRLVRQRLHREFFLVGMPQLRVAEVAALVAVRVQAAHIVAGPGQGARSSEWDIP